MTDTDPLDDYQPPHIEGVPDWCHVFLRELANPVHFGTMLHAARAAGRDYDSVLHWRNKNPDFAAEVARIYEIVNYAIDDELEHLLLTLSLGGVTETTRERVGELGPLEPDDDEPELTEAADRVYRYITKTKVTHDVKALQWLLERRRRSRYGTDTNGLALTGPVTFTFQLGDTKQQALPEAPEGTAQITAETDD